MNHPRHFTRESAILAALEAFDSGRFLADLDRRVSYRTESQVESSAPVLHAYLRNEIAPALGRLGFTSRIVANPAGVDAPILLAERIEGRTCRQSSHMRMETLSVAMTTNGE